MAIVGGTQVENIQWLSHVAFCQQFNETGYYIIAFLKNSRMRISQLTTLKLALTS